MPREKREIILDLPAARATNGYIRMLLRYREMTFGGPLPIWVNMNDFLTAWRAVRTDNFVEGTENGSDNFINTKLNIQVRDFNALVPIPLGKIRIEIHANNRPEIRFSDGRHRTLAAASLGVQVYPIFCSEDSIPALRAICPEPQGMTHLPDRTNLDLT